MRDNLLRALNFRALVSYEGGAPEPQYRYKQPLRCTAFCTSCEQRRIAPTPDWRLDLLSHGCDSSDYESLLGPLPPSKRVNGGYLSDAILFLLESPGSDPDSSEEVTYDGVKKWPPVHHYYWSPDPTRGWPAEPPPRRTYGSYFAYIMRRFGLRNVYITNIVKCGKTRVDTGCFEPFDTTNEGDRRALSNCYDNFLKRELEQLKPVRVFTFGCRASRLFQSASGRDDAVVLLHPAARRTVVRDNDERISAALTGRLNLPIYSPAPVAADGEL